MNPSKVAILWTKILLASRKKIYIYIRKVKYIYIYTSQFTHVHASDWNKKVFLKQEEI